MMGDQRRIVGTGGGGGGATVLPRTGGDGGGEGGSGASTWGPALAILSLGLAIVLFVVGPDVAKAVDLWAATSAYNHCYLIFPISLYLINERRPVVSLLSPRPSFAGLGVVALFSLVWLVGDTASIDELTHVAIVGLLLGVVLATLGRQVFGALLFPLAYLWFLVPTGTFLIPTLQDGTTAISTALLSVSGIPTWVDGNFIQVSTGSYRIVEGCAGLNFLLASVTLATLYGHIVYRGWRKPLTFLAVVVAAAILANGIRVFGIIAIAHVSENQLDIVDDHLVYGWGFFSVILLVVMAVGLRFRDEPSSADVARLAPLSGGSKAVGGTSDRPAAGGRALSPADPILPPAIRPVPITPVTPVEPVKPARVTGIALAMAAAVNVAVAAPLYVAVVRGKTGPLPALASGGTGAGMGTAGGPVAGAADPMVPDEVGPWLAAEDAGTWTPRFPGADRVVRRTYRHRDDGRTVDLLVAFYARQGEGREAASGVNRLETNGVWTQAPARSASTRTGGQPLAVQSIRLTDGARHRLVWQWFWVDGTFTASAVVSKLLQAKAELIGGDRRAAAIAVAVETGPDAAEPGHDPERSLSDFTAGLDLLPRLATVPTPPPR